MAHWYEPRRSICGWRLGGANRCRFRAVFRGEDVRLAPFQGHFRGYEAPEGDEDPQRQPDPARKSWFELWPETPLFATSIDEARVLAAPLLAQLERGDFSGFERRTVAPVERWSPVQEVIHPDREAKALVLRGDTGLFRLQYLVYAPNGSYLPAATPSISSDLEMEWGITWPQDEAGRALDTFADNLEDAVRIASLELDALVHSDPQIPSRKC